MSSKTLAFRFARTSSNVRSLGTIAGSEKIFDKALKGAIAEVAAVPSTPAKIAELRTKAAAAVARLEHLSETTAVCLAGVTDAGVAAELVSYLTGEITKAAIVPAALSDAAAAENFDKLSKYQAARMAAGEATLGRGGLVVTEDDVVEALGLHHVDYVAAATWKAVYAAPESAVATLQKGRESHEALVLTFVVAAAKAAAEPLEQRAAAAAVEAAERARAVATGKVGFFGAVARAVGQGIENAAARAAAAPAAPVNPFRAPAAQQGPFTKTQQQQSA